MIKPRYNGGHIEVKMLESYIRVKCSSFITCHLEEVKVREKKAEWLFRNVSVRGVGVKKEEKREEKSCISQGYKQRAAAFVCLPRNT